MRAGSMGFAAVLAMGMALSMAPGSVIGVLARFFIDDLGLTRTEVGALATFYASVVMTSSLPLGALTDRIGGRRMLVLLLACVSFGVLGMALSWGIWPLFLFAGVAGLPAGGANPATNNLIAERVPVGSRGWITGIKQSGVQLGIFSVGAVLPVTALHLGWRWALALSALIPMAGVAAVLLGIPAGRRRPAAVKKTGPAGSRLPAAVWWLAVYGVAMGIVVAVYVSFLPLYAQEKIEMNLEAAGLVMVVYGAAGAVARVLWGRIAERAGDPAVPLIWIGCLSIGAVLMTWAASPTAALLVWAGSVLMGVGAGAWTAVGMVAAMTMTGPERAGRSAAAIMLGFGLGMTIGPIVFGWGVDASDGYGLPMGCLVLFLAASVALMLLWISQNKRRAAARTRIGRADAV